MVGVTIDVGGLVGILAGVVALAIAVGIAWPVLRSKTTTATIDLLRSELGIEREAREALAQRCGEDTAELRGQVGVLAGAFAEGLAERVATAISKSVADALGGAGVVDRRRPDSR